MVSLVILLVLLHISIGFPVEYTDFLSNYSKDYASDYSYSELSSLVGSYDNQVLFASLQHATNDFFDPDQNVVGTVQFTPFNRYQRQPYVANGYIGSRIPNLGQGFSYDQETNYSGHNEGQLLQGWPLVNKRYAGAFVAGFYDAQPNTTQSNFVENLKHGWESVMAAVPQWTTLELNALVDGEKWYVLDPSAAEKAGDIADYAQTLSFEHGVVSTEFTWLGALRVRIDVAAHRARSSVGLVRLTATNIGNSSVQVAAQDRVDFESAQRAEYVSSGFANDSNGIYMHFQPQGVSYVDGAIFTRVSAQPAAKFHHARGDKKVSQTAHYVLQPNKKWTVSKVVGIVTTDLYDVSDVVSAARDAGAVGDYNSLLAEHKAAWSKTLENTISVDFSNNRLLTLAARASLFHLAANTRPDATGVTAALPVGGLSSDSYAGLVFWDADLWMLSGLLPFLPDHARSIVNYRVHTHKQAQENLPDGYSGAVYPWTSGRFGNCTGTGPCMDYEYHINFDIARSAWEVYLSGSVDDSYLEEVVYPLVNDAALFFADYVKYNDSLDNYWTYNLTDPDEYANQVDNGAFTNAAISLLMRWANVIGTHLGKDVPDQFEDIAGNMYIPAAEPDNITLEYSGMEASVGIKQADVIMMTYPLQNELLTEEQAYENMQFYSKKQVSYGPGMTFQIFAIVAAALAPTGCASQAYLTKAVEPFLRGPFAQFSEQNNDDYNLNGGTYPAFPFLTAHGGFLQSLVQGITGLRFSYDVVDGEISRVLEFSPVDVPCVDGILFEGIKFSNHSLTLNITGSKMTVTDTAGEGSITIRSGSDTHELQEGDSIELDVNKADVSNVGSVAECSAVFTNITEGSMGDVALLMNDGDNTTHWEAKYNDLSAKILIDLKEFKNLTSGWISWGDKPPKSVQLSYFDEAKVPRYPELTTLVDFLSYLDFGDDLADYYTFNNAQGTTYNYKDVFTTAVKEDVDVSAPYNKTQAALIEIPTIFNVTTFEIDVYSRFLLLEFEGIHNTEPIDNDTGGAKVYEVALYE